MEYGFSWENVLYVHLYIADMNDFAMANETYVRFITQEKCRFGVPSRSTVELPLTEVGFGKAYVEVLVASDHSKRVLHVQSISCWAPSCIGPYSQATLHKEILHMAGQLGLDPPTMSLCSGGPTAELEQALENCDAVAKCFKCSISTSAILLVIYCSTRIRSSERINIQEKQNAYLKQKRTLCLDGRNVSEVLEPIFLYVLVPDLPKSALVEVKPILYAAEDTENATDYAMHDLPNRTPQSYWGFQKDLWHDLCLQKCIVQGRICAVLLSITDELAVKICSESKRASQVDDGDRQALIAEGKMEKIAKFCVYLLDRILLENCFSWDDTTNLRIYFPTSLHMSQETLLPMFVNVFNEFAEMSRRFKISKEPIFNIVPVLGSGRSATSVDDIITCELFARKS